MHAQLCLTVCDPMDCTARQTPQSMGFSGKEYLCDYSLWAVAFST